MTLHIIELLVALVIAKTIGKWWLNREVLKRLCDDCGGLGRVEYPYRGAIAMRPCHTCHMRGTKR